MQNSPADRAHILGANVVEQTRSTKTMPTFNSDRMFKRGHAYRTCELLL